MANESQSEKAQSAPNPPGEHGNNSASSGLFKTVDGRTIEIRDVWASNLEEEMEHIRDIIEKYQYVAMVSKSDKSVLSYFLL